MTKKVVRIFPENGPKNVKICTFCLKNWTFLTRGPAFGSTTPGPTLALYAPGSRTCGTKFE